MIAGQRPRSEAASDEGAFCLLPANANFRNHSRGIRFLLQTFFLRSYLPHTPLLCWLSESVAMAADLRRRGRCVAVVLFLCLILGIRSISAERLPAGSSANGRVEDSKPLLGRLVHYFSKNGSHEHAWPV